MKELSIEEKAKRYDEAIERTKIYYITTDSVVDTELIELIFPELKESEDERIRKELIEYIKDQQSSFISAPDCRDKYEEEENNKYNSWIAWLEKQSMPQVRTDSEWVNAIDDACDKRYSEEYAHGEYCHEQSFKWGFQEGVDWLEKQGEKKSSWSEEDEEHLRVCKNALKKYQITDKCNSYIISQWLDNKLKSLKWKPSDKQMNALNDVISSRDIKYDILSELWKDLKKLKGE